MNRLLLISTIEYANKNPVLLSETYIGTFCDLLSFEYFAIDGMLIKYLELNDMSDNLIDELNITRHAQYYIIVDENKWLNGMKFQILSNEQVIKDILKL